jgi:HEAT repeat protein
MPIVQTLLRVLGLGEAPSNLSRKARLREIRARKEIAALGTLVEALDDPDAGVREEAMLALYGLGRDARPALDRVLRGLQDPHERVRQWAASALAPGSLDPPTEEVVPPLIACFQVDPSSAVRREVLAILGAHLSHRSAALLPVVVPVFLAGLHDPSVEVRRTASYYVGSCSAYFCSDERYTKIIAAGLHQGASDPDPQVQERCAVALARFDPDNLAALPVLDRMLRKPERPHVVRDAAETLQRLRGEAPRRLAAALLRSPELPHRLRAAFLLPPDQAPFSVFLDALRAPSAALLEEFQVLLPLRPFSGPEEEALRAAAIALLRASDAAVQKEALRLLARWGKGDPHGIREVIRLVGSPREELRREAAEALGRMCKAPEVAVPVLRGLLEDHDEEVARDACRALGWFGKEAAEAVPAMVGLLRRCKAGYTRTTALYALGSVGPAAAEAIPAMVELLESQESGVREGAAEGLARVKASGALLGGRTPEVIVDGLVRGSSSLRGGLLRAVATCGEAGAPFAEAVGGLLGSEDGTLREQALGALEAFGAGASGALPAIRRALPEIEERAAQRWLRLLGSLREHLDEQDEEALLRLVRARPGVRGQVAELEALGARGALALLEVTQSQDESLCRAAGEAIRRRGEELLPALERALWHEDSSLRLRAVGALVELGEAAHPALRRALWHEDELVRAQAEMALLPQQSGVEVG